MSDKLFECYNCNELMELTKFYNRNGKPYSYCCKLCQKEIEREKSLQHKLDNFGAGKVLNKPNTYMNDIQQQSTFEVMQSLGYKFDTSTGIWYKSGVKEIIDGKPYFLKINKLKRRAHKLTPEVRAVIDELLAKGITNNQIALRVNVSITTIRTYVRRKEC
jgi:hypothetical protein